MLEAVVSQIALPDKRVATEAVAVERAVMVLVVHQEAAGAAAAESA